MTLKPTKESKLQSSGNFKFKKVEKRSINLRYLSIPIAVKVNIETQTMQIVMNCDNGHRNKGNLQ